MPLKPQMEEVTYYLPGSHHAQLLRVGDLDWNWRISNPDGQELVRGCLPGDLTPDVALRQALSEWEMEGEANGT